MTTTRELLQPFARALGALGQVGDDLDALGDCASVTDLTGQVETIGAFLEHVVAEVLLVVDVETALAPKLEDL